MAARWASISSSRRVAIALHVAMFRSYRAAFGRRNRDVVARCSIFCLTRSESGADNEFGTTRYNEYAQRIQRSKQIEIKSSGVVDKLSPSSPQRLTGARRVEDEARVRHI